MKKVMKKLIRKGKGVTILPEITVSAPRKYFVGYDSNGNPLYTTNYSYSQLALPLPEGEIEQRRKLWLFDNIGSNGQVRPGLHGDAADLTLAAEIGIGGALVPLAITPIATSLNPVLQFASTPLSSTAEAIGAEGAIPYALLADNSIIGITGLHGLKQLIKNVKDGKTSLYKAIPAIGLNGLMSKLLINGRTLFGITSLMPNVRFSLIANFFRTPINKNPFKGMYTYLDKRRLASERLLKNINSESNYSTTTGNPSVLLRLRVTGRPWSKYRVIDDVTPEQILDNVPVREHTSLIQSFKDLKDNGVSTWNAFVSLPLYYNRINSSPGLYFGNGINKSFIHINPYLLKRYNFNKALTIAHELAHALWDLGEPQIVADGMYHDAFNFNGLPLKIQDYFNRNEIAARGTLLKNYFGISDDRPITSDMLKYAAKHYVLDTGLNNNMNQMFRSIKDWDKAAEWLSKYSYKEGGKL